MEAPGHNAVDDLLAELRESEGRPRCFGDVGFHIVEFGEPKGKCGHCDFQRPCSLEIADSLNLLNREKPDCFANPSDRIHSSRFGKCLACEFDPLCKRIVAERTMRSGVAQSAALKEHSVKGGPQDCRTAAQARSGRLAEGRAASAPVGGVSTPSEYVFPSHDGEFQRHLATMRDKDAAMLANFVRDLSAKESPSGGPRPYEEIRILFCAASIALNEKKRIPPSLRAARRLGRQKEGKRPAIDTVLLNDRQVIDLNFLKHVGKRQPQGKWQRLFAAGEFPFELASKFAAQTVPFDRKVAQLSMPKSTQLLLAQLHAKAVGTMLRAVHDRHDELLSDLQDDVANARRRMTPETASALPNAFFALRLTGGSPSRAVMTYRLITGEDHTATEMSGWKRWLARNGYLVG